MRSGRRFSPRVSLRLHHLAMMVLVALPVSVATAECPEYRLDDPILYTTGPVPLFIVPDDFNEDGILDLAVTNSDASYGGGYNPSVAILIGTGPRTYAPAVLYPVATLPIGLVAADFNEDGILDLAASCKEGHVVSVLLGQGSGGVGNGSFASAVNYAAGSGPFQIVAADFNEDGILDLACSLNIEPGVSFLRGQGTGGVGNGTFAPHVTFGLANLSTGLDYGDFDEDGHLDLLATENYNGTFALLLGMGTGSFLAPLRYPSGGEPFDFAVADLDEDGNLDVAVASIGQGGSRAFLGDGNGGFPSSWFVGPGNNSHVVAADLDQDGILDLAIGQVTSNRTGNLRIHEGLGAGGVGNGTYGPAQFLVQGMEPYQLAAGDFDGDTHQDVLFSDFATSNIALLPGTCESEPPDPPDARKPVLTDVRDVPSDQGGKVFLTWDASSLDVPGGAVTSYRVWRRVHPEGAASAAFYGSDHIHAHRVVGSEAVATEYWEALATLPAQRMPGYGYTAATTQDSTRHSNRYTAFFVTALTNNIDVFYSSDVDSGYSVDNIRPSIPVALSGKLEASGVVLSWDANGEPDLEGYYLHRGSSEDFEPSESNRIAATDDVEYVDAGGTGMEYYKLSAVDTHDNESGFAVLEPMAPTGVDDLRSVLALRGIRPNPSRDGALTIDLSLARNAPARLEILDLSGRRVAVRELDGASRSVTFRDGERLPVGVYLVRLLQGPEMRQLKAIVMR